MKVKIPLLVVLSVRNEPELSIVNAITIFLKCNYQQYFWIKILSKDSDIFLKNTQFLHVVGINYKNSYP
jgi:hypothetical protein